MGVALLVICFGLAFFLAKSPKVPPLVPFALPVALGVFYMVARRDEKAATSGDPQPGLVALVGVASVVLVLVAMLAGYRLRNRSRLRNRR
jgi:hypothetical protein